MTGLGDFQEKGMSRKKGKDKKATFFMPPFFNILKNGEYRDLI